MPGHRFASAIAIAATAFFVITPPAVAMSRRPAPSHDAGATNNNGGELPLTASSLVVGAASASTACSWSDQSPSATSESTKWKDLAAISANDVLAVGFRIPNDGIASDSQSVISRWDGVSWSPVAHPSPPDSALSGISVASPTNIWAVGHRYVDETARGYVLHYDGSSWSEVPSPAASIPWSPLSSVDARPRGAIAVGSIGFQPLIMRWDGAAWSLQDSPTPRSGGLESAVMLSPRDAWAAGWRSLQHRTLIEHWNGRRWRVVQLPDEGSDASFGRIASVPGTDQLWATGTDGTHAVFAHHDGAAWTIVPSAMTDHRQTQISDVVAMSETDAWAVGTAYVPAAPFDRSVDLVEHWDGSSWTISQLPPDTGEGLGSVDGVPGADQVWAIGSRWDIDAGLAHPTALRRC